MVYALRQLRYTPSAGVQRRCNDALICDRTHIAVVDTGVLVLLLEEGLPDDVGEAYFHPYPKRYRPKEPLPTIVLVRGEVPAKRREPDLHGEQAIDETITLAHEYGHFCSWNQGRISNAGQPSKEWLEYHEAAKARDALHEAVPVGAPFLYRDLDEQQKALIDEEEKRAWRKAREVIETREGIDERRLF